MRAGVILSTTPAPLPEKSNAFLKFRENELYDSELLSIRSKARICVASSPSGRERRIPRYKGVFLLA